MSPAARQFTAVAGGFVLLALAWACLEQAAQARAGDGDDTTLPTGVGMVLFVLAQLVWRLA